MTQISTAVARGSLAEIINRSAFGKERIFLSRHGKNIVAVVPAEDIQILEAIEEEMDIKTALAALKEAKKKGTIPWEKAKEEL